MSADYETDSFKVYAHTDKGFLHIVWRDGSALGSLGVAELAELAEIRRQWLDTNPWLETKGPSAEVLEDQR